jgi:hypothetical protein
MWKIIKTIALRNMYKSTALIEKMAAIENTAEPKIIADGKIMADVKINTGPKILADGEIPWLEKNRRIVKSLQALKSPCLMKYLRP